MNIITKIYLVTNCYGDPNKVYIGKTKSCRKNDHKRTFGNDIIYDYIDEVNSLKKEDWEPLETFWIQYFKFLGFNIQNKKLKGGGGPEFRDETTRIKISNSNKGIPKPKPIGFGFNRNEEVIKNMSRPILQYDLEGNFIKEWYGIKYASKTLGIWGIGDCLSNKNITAGGFVWRYKDYPIIGKFKLPLPKHCKKIIQYSKLGVYISKYNSINEASSILNINQGDISLCCLKKKLSVGGYIWRYEDDPIEVNYMFPKRKSKNILQFDLENNFIKKWDTAKDIENELGFNMRYIFRCCGNNKRKNYKGFIWKYE